MDPGRGRSEGFVEDEKIRKSWIEWIEVRTLKRGFIFIQKDVIPLVLGFF